MTSDEKLVPLPFFASNSAVVVRCPDRDRVLVVVAAATLTVDRDCTEEDGNWLVEPTQHFVNVAREAVEEWQDEVIIARQQEEKG